MGSQTTQANFSNFRGVPIEIFLIGANDNEGGQLEGVKFENQLITQISAKFRYQPFYILWGIRTRKFLINFLKGFVYFLEKSTFPVWHTQLSLKDK